MSSPPTARRPRPAADAGLLFDEPGPRGRRRIAVVSVVVTVVVLGLLAAALHQLDAICVFGLIYVASRLALANRRGEGEDNAKSLAFVLAGAILCGAAGGLITALQ